MRRVAPHNPRPSQPGTSELKGMLGYGSLNNELQDAERLLARSGHINTGQRQESSVVSAMRANEALVKSSALKQQQRQQEEARRKQIVQEHNVPKPNTVQESQRQQEAYAAGAVSAALYKLERDYGYGAVPKTETHPAHQSPTPRPVRYEQTTTTAVMGPSTRREQYITRQQPSNVVTRHLCDEPGCRNLARYKNYGTWSCEKHNVWGSLGSR